MKKISFHLFCASLITVLFSCNPAANNTTNTKTSVVDSIFPSPAAFKETVGQKETSLYFLKNSKGALAAITNYGARLVGLAVPDKEGKLVDVVLGYDSVKSY